MSTEKFGIFHPISGSPILYYRPDAFKVHAAGGQTPGSTCLQCLNRTQLDGNIHLGYTFPAIICNILAFSSGD